MPDRARMHAANLTGRSQCGVAARSRSARRIELNRRMKGFEGEELRRGGWILFIPENGARFSAELRRTLIDSAFAAIDGTLAKSVRRSRHAETWIERFGGNSWPFVYIKVLDAARGLRAIRLLFTGPPGGAGRPDPK